tara:strand:+ start:14725 stop:15255 length:531 start_codon:yes stop_codon:yes gene_type:complete
MLFNKLPKTNFKNVDITDIIRGIKLTSFTFDVNFALNDFVIQSEHTRPDVIAELYYDDPRLAWVVLLPNVSIDPYYEWPLSQREFDRWMTKKYGSVPTAQATVLHYEHKTKDLTISEDTFTYSTSAKYILASDYQPVYAYNHYDRINENRRFIKLIDSQYLPIIMADLKRLFKTDG